MLMAQWRPRPRLRRRRRGYRVGDVRGELTSDRRSVFRTAARVARADAPTVLAISRPRHRRSAADVQFDAGDAGRLEHAGHLANSSTVSPAIFTMTAHSSAHRAAPYREHFSIPMFWSRWN